LRADYGDRLEEHDYMKEDFMGTVEAAYLQQCAELLEAERALGKAAGLRERLAKRGHL